MAGVTSGLISDGEEVSWEARHFGRLWRMTSRISNFDPPQRFVDQMVRGPFASFRHEHRFDIHGRGIRMTDLIEFRMGRRPLGLAADPIVGAYLRRLMRIRNATIRGKAESGCRLGFVIGSW